MGNQVSVVRKPLDQSWEVGFPASSGRRGPRECVVSENPVFRALQPSGLLQPEPDNFRVREDTA
jgi:hypothetical protein